MIMHMCVCFLLYFSFLVGLDYRVQEYYYYFFPRCLCSGEDRDSAASFKTGAIPVVPNKNNF